MHVYTNRLTVVLVAFSFTQVTYKLKLPVDELCKEIKVSKNPII